MNPAYCGPYTYTFQESYSWLTFQVANPSVINIYTIDPAAVIGSPFTINVDVKLTNFPTVQSITKQF